MSPLVSLVTTTLALVLGPTAGGGTEPLRTVVYDLRAVGPDLSTEMHWEPLLPFLSHEQDWSVDEDEIREHVSELLWHLWGHEFEYEGRQLEALDRGRLLVTAPEAIHARIERLLDALAAAFQRRATVDWTLFAVPDPDRLPEPVDEQQVAQLVADGVLVPLQRRSERLEVGRTVVRRMHDARRVVRGWDAAVAQTAAQAEPVLATLVTGITLALRAESAGAGDTLRLRYLHGLSHLRRLDSRSVGQSSRVMLEGVVDELTREALVDQAVVERALRAGSGLLAPGGSLLDVGAVRTHGGSVSLALQITLADVEPVPPSLVLEDAAVAVLDTSSLYWQPLDPPRLAAGQLRGADHDGGDMDGYRKARLERLAFPSAEIDEEHAGWRLLERLEWEDVDVHWSRLGSWLLVAAPPEAVERVRAGVDELLAGSRPLVLELGLARREDGGTVARCRLPLEAGTAGMALVGDARSLLDGYDLDVATGAAIATPRLVDVFDGLSLRATAELTGALRVEVVSHRLVDLDTVDLRNVVAEAFQRPRFATAEVAARVPGDGRRHVLAVLGSARDGGDALELWARVRPRGPGVR